MLCKSVFSGHIPTATQSGTTSRLSLAISGAQMKWVTNLGFNAYKSNYWYWYVWLWLTYIDFLGHESYHSSGLFDFWTSNWDFVADVALRGVWCCCGQPGENCLKTARFHSLCFPFPPESWCSRVLETGDSSAARLSRRLALALESLDFLATFDDSEKIAPPHLKLGCFPNISVPRRDWTDKQSLGGTLWKWMNPIQKNGRTGKLGSEGLRFRWEAVMFLFNVVNLNVWLSLFDNFPKCFVEVDDRVLCCATPFLLPLQWLLHLGVRLPRFSDELASSAFLSMPMPCVWIGFFNTFACSSCRGSASSLTHDKLYGAAFSIKKV